jgi:deoxyribonuclease V
MGDHRARSRGNFGPEMIACLDVHYFGSSAASACVRFAGWEAREPAAERIQVVRPIEPYQPGQFYRRELPCLLAVLKADPLPECAVVDGYVWLDGQGRAGLGAHLFEALERRVAVVGVAKTAFAGAAHAVAVLRPGSRRPLYVTAAGLESQEASRLVARMAGAHRIPSMLGRADAIARESARRIGAG